MSTKPPSTADLQTTARPSHPYPGLRPFEAEEWSIFFGREQMIDDVIDRLAAHHLVLIHGSSGSGKSSLVRAGVLPTLARQHRRARAPWLTCSMRPSGGPLWNLAKEFAQMEGRADDVARIDEIVRDFSRRDATLSSVFGSLKNLRGQRLCILVDQFEELFRFEKETSREEAELFVDLLVRGNTGEGKASEIAVEAGDAKDRDNQPAAVHIVVTMRSEYLGECARFRGLAEAINRTQYLVPGMERDALMRAIRRPAMLYGGEVSLELAEKLITEAAGREDELPLIQHGLMYLWNAAIAKAKAEPIPIKSNLSPAHSRESGNREVDGRSRVALDPRLRGDERTGDNDFILLKPAPGEKIVLDGAALEQAGGLVNLLSSNADATVDEAAPDQERRDAVERLFRALTDLNIEGKAIRRPQAFRDLVAVTEIAPDKLRAIIDVFRRDGVSFLTPYSKQPITDNTPIDISHEALMRCWHRLADPQNGWLKHEFDDGLIWRSLLVEAKGFETNQRRILSPATTEDRWKWRRERHVNEHWASRYGGNFSLVGKLIVASRKNARRKRQLQYGFVAMLLFISCAGTAYAIWTNSEYLELRWAMFVGPRALAPAGEQVLKPKDEFQECARCPVMVVVPAGEFVMRPVGSQARVTFAKPFAVSKFEVTFDQWDACYQLGGCKMKLYDQEWGRASRPAINVSWNDAQEYVAWLSKQTGKTYRLISEAEWQYAARAGSTTAYWWGGEVKRDGKVMANCIGCGSEWDNKRTAPVGSFPANPFGLYDMHGNVWEWVEDCYGKGSTGEDCSIRVACGGSWINGETSMRSNSCFSNTTDHRDIILGFRLGRTITP